MHLKRRAFLSGAAALPIAHLLTTPAIAQISIGAATLTTVSDGTLVLPGNLAFAQMPQDALAPILAAYGVSRDRVMPECNVALYRDGTNTVLFDVGAGPDFMPTAGTVIDNLAAMGVTPEVVTHVLFTHAHPDHIWGLLDDFDEPVFANAVFMMGRKEWDYWWNPETVTTIGEARMVFAVGAKRRMQAIENQIELFDDGQEILPGIAAVSSYGHTPGHMSFEVRAGGDAALVIGDAIGNHHVAFHQPTWRSGSDQDSDLAVTTRRDLLDRITQDKLKIVGFHLPNGGIGRVEKSSDGYRFLGDL